MKLKINKIQFYLIVITILTTFMLIFLNIDRLLILDVLGILISLIICFRDSNSNIFYIFFLISVFIFLISGDLVEELFGKQYWLSFSEDASNHTHISIFISLVSMIIGFLLIKTPKKNKSIPKENSEKRLQIVSHVSRLVYYLTFIILIVDTLFKVIYVHRYRILYVLFKIYFSIKRNCPNW